MVKLSAKSRDIKAKISAVRNIGMIPAVIYGPGIKNSNVAVGSKDFKKVFDQAGESTLVDLEVEGQKMVKVLINDVSVDPVSDKVMHIDFYQVKMDKEIESRIPLSFIGEAPAVKEQGGILVKNMHELHIKALPQDLIHDIEVDISNLININDKMFVSDIKLPKGVKVINKLEDIVVMISAPREEEEEIKPEMSVEDIKVVGEEEKKAKAEEKAAQEKDTK